MVSQSTIQPDPLELETRHGTIVRDGTVRVTCRWDIVEVTLPGTEDEPGVPGWEYQEATITWALPDPYLTRDEILAYLATVQDELFGFARAASMTF